ncbi:MAG TPA: glucose 1-dehydrogenase [Pseudomonadales bacterium]|nr:glucose 1-dehydrogenase [Pseudomonadales bacterium]
MNRVDGKVAIVTGGGSGIGAATSKLLATAGASVVVADIDGPSAGQVAGEILEAGGSALALHQDVTDPGQWDEVIEKTIAEYGKLDVLVNNAGVSGAGMGTLEEQSFENWRRILSINLDAVYLGTQRAVMTMKDTGGGSIVNISSVMGIVGGAGAAYNASKGGVRLLTKSVAVHCGTMGYNIRVNSVHPGYIWTPMVRNIVDVAPAEANLTEDGLRAMLVEKHPIGRLGEAEDIARGVLFLASDDSSFMTGSELVIDGGYTAV